MGVLFEVVHRCGRDLSHVCLHYEHQLYVVHKRGSVCEAIIVTGKFFGEPDEGLVFFLPDFADIVLVINVPVIG